MVVLRVASLALYGIQMATTELSVDTKRGIPYCRGCGRQASYRRVHCRACGRSLYVPRQPAQEGPNQVALRRESRRKAQDR
jgi:hypothetical protein